MKRACRLFSFAVRFNGSMPRHRRGEEGSMYTVYILRNTKTGRYYIGSTNNIDRRIEEHNRGQTRSTRYAKNNWVILYTEQYLTMLEAHQREFKIKSFKGGNAFKRLVRV